jgi:hypothetical protein
VFADGRRVARPSELLADDAALARWGIQADNATVLAAAGA